MGFDKCLYPCNHHLPQDLEHPPISSGGAPSCPWQSGVPQPQPKTTSDFLGHNSSVCLLQNFMSGIVQQVLFAVWLLLASMFLRRICAVLLSLVCTFLLLSSIFSFKTGCTYSLPLKVSQGKILLRRGTIGTLASHFATSNYVFTFQGNNLRFPCLPLFAFGL